MQRPTVAYQLRVTAMATDTEPMRIPDDRLSIEKRDDGALVVRVQSEGPEEALLPQSSMH